MHTQLEDYLNEVAKGLGSLPMARREEELSEIRQHLLNAVVIGKEQGQAENEAILAAIEQFGTPQAVSKQIVSAWQRGVWRDRRDLWGTIIAAPLVGIGLLFGVKLFMEGVLKLYPSSYVYFGHHMALFWVLMNCLLFFVHGLTGAVLGAVVPKQAVRGIGWSIVVYGCGWVVWHGTIPVPTNASGFLGAAEEWLKVLSAVLVAWIVSRRRGARRAVPLQ